MRYQFSLTDVSPRILRRLSAAEGYLDLEMPRQALAELDSLDDYGPLEAPMQFLRGQALKAQHRFEEAIVPLQRAAELIPAPHNRVAWLSLSQCFREQGRIALADALEKFAESSQQAYATPLFQLGVQVEPIDLDEDDSDDDVGLAGDEVDEIAFYSSDLDDELDMESDDEFGDEFDDDTDDFGTGLNDFEDDFDDGFGNADFGDDGFPPKG